VAVVVGHSTFAHEPGLFTTAPVGAMQKLLGEEPAGADSVDFYEINEAFAVVTMAAMHDLKLPRTRSTSTAAPARWATPSAPPARASSSP
jgi:acetyl-CoA C-acetyltransferase